MISVMKVIKNKMTVIRLTPAVPAGLSKFMICIPYPVVKGLVSSHLPRKAGSYLPVDLEQVILSAELPPAATISWLKSLNKVIIQRHQSSQGAMARASYLVYVAHNFCKQCLMRADNILNIRNL